MNDNNRRYSSPEQKVAILREHLIEGKAVSELCESRYVRLEASYAFSLNKPILPVRLEEIELKGLPGGLRLLLNSIQTMIFVWKRFSGTSGSTVSDC